MSRRLTALSLFALGVFAVGTAAQPPATDKKKVETRLESPKPAVDTAIDSALANDPDVRMARAKIQLAEAELAKARQAVTMKVVTLRAAIVEQRKAVATAGEGFALLQAVAAKELVNRTELLFAREKLETVQSTLARTETELKLITESGGGAAHAANVCPAGLANSNNCAACHSVATGTWQTLTADRRIDVFRTLMAQAKTANGPIPERIRAALDKPINLGVKNDRVTFEAALEAFKKAGLDVPVRVNQKMNSILCLGGEELPIGAWLQLFADQTPDSLMLVRDYGLLITGIPLNPPKDALSVFELWKQKPAAADAPKK